MSREEEVNAVCDLLSEQNALLWQIYHDATAAPPEEVIKKADLANFLFRNSLHIHQMSDSALVLMFGRRPYSVGLLARSALESAFNLRAAALDTQFGPQRMAHELEELGRKLRSLTHNGYWPANRRPTPAECDHEAARIRREYDAAVPATNGERDRIAKIERIAGVANLSPLYDDDYRQLSLAIHSNQAGILNSASGFLVRKGMLSLCNSTFLASRVLTEAFQIKSYYSALEDHFARTELLMRQPDLLESPSAI